MNTTTKEQRKMYDKNSASPAVFNENATPSGIPKRDSEDFGPGNSLNSSGRGAAPPKACIFRETSIVGFTDGPETEKKNFRIVGYSGQIIKNHWYWGNLAFDLDGIKFDKTKTAVLEEHIRENRLGFTTRQETKPVVLADGKFLENENAKKVRQDMLDGFPMQASLYCVPSVIERVEQGASVLVNNQKLDGPGTVFRKSTIFEVSLCCLGADNQTSGEVFDKNEEINFDILEKEKSMETVTKIQLTRETFAAEYPELSAEIAGRAKEEGVKAEMVRFVKFADGFAKDPAFCIEQFKAGKTIEEATAAYAAKLAAENETLKAAAAKQTPVPPAKPVDPAIQTFADDASDDKNKAKAAPDTEEGWKEEFAKSKALQDEFGDDGVKDYIAFKKADKGGKVKIFVRK